MVAGRWFISMFAIIPLCIGSFCTQVTFAIHTHPFVIHTVVPVAVIPCPCRNPSSSVQSRVLLIQSRAFLIHSNMYTPTVPYPYSTGMPTRTSCMCMVVWT